MTRIYGRVGAGSHASEDTCAGIVLMHGEPGAGKTTLARVLAAALGGVHIEMDDIWRERQLKPESASLRATRRVYRVGIHRAVAEARRGMAAILDCTSRSKEFRDAVRVAAHERGLDVVTVECSAPKAIVARRVMARAITCTGHLGSGLAHWVWARRSSDPIEPGDAPVVRIRTACGYDSPVVIGSTDATNRLLAVVVQTLGWLVCLDSTDPGHGVINPGLGGAGLARQTPREECGLPTAYPRGNPTDPQP